MNLRFLLSFCLLLSFLASAQAQPIYRWVEEDGSIHHYGHQPPPHAPYQPLADAAAEETEAASALPEFSPPDTLPFSQGLLWKIEAPPAREAPPPPSYLFGTIHSEDQRVARLPAEVRRALRQSEAFCMELLPDIATALTLTKSMLYADEQTLQEAIGQPLFDQLVPLMRQRGVPAQALTKFKPWAAYMTLSAPQTKTGRFLDLLLYEQAKQQRKSICGIETAEEQVAVFARTPLADQVALLQGLVRDPQAVEMQLQKLIPLYLQRDLAGLFTLSADVADATAQERRSVAAFLKRLLDDRNRRMVARLLPKLDEGNLFVAVGALHLPGAQGLLQLLTERGYAVSVVY